MSRVGRRMDASSPRWIIPTIIYCCSMCKWENGLPLRPAVFWRRRIGPRTAPRFIFRISWTIRNPYFGRMSTRSESRWSSDSEILSA